jgi:two-component system, NarL family, sensor histidine kinase BarA
MAKGVRISLANKCQLLFGAAVLIILTAALSVVWLRMQALVREEQEETARRLAKAWLADMIQLGGALTSLDRLSSATVDAELGLTLTLIERDEFEVAAREDTFLAHAIERFETRDDRHESFRPGYDAAGLRYFRYARAIRKSDMLRIQGGAAVGFAAPTIDATGLADPLEMVLVIQLRSDRAERQLMLNRIFIVTAGLLAGLLAIAVFWFITTRLILSPVRVLRETAEKVSDGDLNIRSDINTGDEFEQLSDMFNHMLETIKSNQDQLKSINKGLDLKLGELAQHNIALYEANKIKGEFLANVSHELRTPLNSIIGFAEVLEDALQHPTPAIEKRKRYIGNIIISSRRLLDLINDLLDLAKIEAGRVELRVGPTSISDTAEGLVNLIKPQADKKQIDLQLKVARNIPVVCTDAGKLQQIVFNFLSNAVKFTPAGGRVTLFAELIEPTGVETERHVRIGVSDTGPGIPLDQQDRIFEKFTQLDATVTKEHGGTGLGLTISRDLAALLHGRITLDSDTGRGATFSLIVPLGMPSGKAKLVSPDLMESEAAGIGRRGGVPARP